MDYEIDIALESGPERGAEIGEKVVAPTAAAHPGALRQVESEVRIGDEEYARPGDGNRHGSPRVVCPGDGRRSVHAQELPGQ